MNNETNRQTTPNIQSGFKPFLPTISYEEADQRASRILAQLSLEEKIQLIGGHDRFYIKDYEKHGIPSLRMTDATQGIRLLVSARDLNGKPPLEKSTAFPCPLLLTATWNTELARQYALSVGEECRAGGYSFLLGPGMNIYRISQNGRNFEYFGEDPWLAARMIENYVVGVQSTGTIATLKHFLLNNTDFRRRTSNAIVDERTLHEIYLPAFKAGIDAGAMAVMTSYNPVDGEWAGQSAAVINRLLKTELGFRWLVMSDWWSTYDPEKVIKSGQDLEMPGDDDNEQLFIDMHLKYVKAHAARLVKEGRVQESDIDRMVRTILRTCIAMGLYDRPVQDKQCLARFPEHVAVALQAAREGMVLLRNEDNCLPLAKEKLQTILVTGEYANTLAHGGGSGKVDGYDQLTLGAALEAEFGEKVVYAENPSREQLKAADVVLLAVGTPDSEGWDRSFDLPQAIETNIEALAQAHPRVVVIVYSGSGIRMTDWNEKVAAIIYAWYPGQIGNKALVEILAGKTNPSGKLPMTIEKRFEDSPGYPYLPPGEELYEGVGPDIDIKHPFQDIVYKEGVFVGYRWYEAKRIDPLYAFGFGLSYTSFTYSDLQFSSAVLEPGATLTVSFTIKNNGAVAGQEIAQLYVEDVQASVSRPVKELKGFAKFFLKPGESKKVQLLLTEKELAYWDVKQHGWRTEPGEFRVLIGAASNDIRLSGQLNFSG